MRRGIQPARNVSADNAGLDIETTALRLGLEVQKVLESQNLKQVYFSDLRSIVLRPGLSAGPSDNLSTWPVPMVSIERAWELLKDAALTNGQITEAKPDFRRIRAWSYLGCSQTTTLFPSFVGGI